MTGPATLAPYSDRVMTTDTTVHARPRVRESGLWAYENALRRLGFPSVAGVDEAGRGACAGPLVAGAVILPEGRRGRVPGLADSKLLSAAARERVYGEVVARASAWVAVVVPAADVDRIGLHRANVAALRRALCLLDPAPSYALSDGFPIAGLGVPGLAMWKGDRVAACIAAASVIAKVTRDRLMVEMHELFPVYNFAGHKGYCTAEHQAALRRHGPCAEHRRSFANVAMSENAPSEETEDTDDLPGDLIAVGPGGTL